MENVNQILEIFQGFRMAPMANIDQYEQKGKALLAEKLNTFVSAGKTIEFVMLGYPMKSMNTRDKVLGALPDMAEQVSLENFANFNQQIKKIYAPGVNINIVNDGFVFNDLLGAEDKTVEQYAEIVGDMGRQAPMTWHNLTSFYKGGLAGARQKLDEHFGITETELEHRIMFNSDVNLLYRGMLHFMEEEIAVRDYPSRNQKAKEAKILTRKMMLRNEAYSNLVKQEFKSHVRLSMHPSINDGAKYSFKLINTPNYSKSPWHCVVMKNEFGEWETVHKKQAVELGAELVSKYGQPFYYKKQIND